MSLASRLAKRALDAGRQPALARSRQAASTAAAPQARRAIAALPPAKAPIALLPPALTLFPAARRPANKARSAALDAAWSRHRSAVDTFYTGGVARHNAAVKVAKVKVERFADGPFARAASADLNRLARASERPLDIAAQGIDGIRRLAAKRPSLEQLVAGYRELKRDPNAVRRWIKDLADWLPTF